MLIYSHFYDFIAKLILIALLVACLFIIQAEYWESLMIAQWGFQAVLAKLMMISFVCRSCCPLWYGLFTCPGYLLPQPGVTCVFL
ncbi:MAG: hypothetical protein IPL27_21440 [Lewinellaceae bacterium]|nr:hypothetical protein [Lewinellaceae bacterium]